MDNYTLDEDEYDDATKCTSAGQAFDKVFLPAVDLLVGISAFKLKAKAYLNNVAILTGLALLCYALNLGIWPLFVLLGLICLVAAAWNVVCIIDLRPEKKEFVKEIEGVLMNELRRALSSRSYLDYLKAKHEYISEYEPTERAFETTKKTVAPPVSKPALDLIPELASKLEQDLRSKKKQPPVPNTRPQLNLRQHPAYVTHSNTSTYQNGSYPIIGFPDKGTIIRSFRQREPSIRGYKEADFQIYIGANATPLWTVLGDAYLATNATTRAYEPDIAIAERAGDTAIRIDVEIDEPYSGTSRLPIHLRGDSRNRDQYFLDRGWSVVRFSERQVHHHPGTCLKILETVFKLMSGKEPHEDLEKLAEQIKEPCWDHVQAANWAKDNYREEYLDHEFTAHKPGAGPEAEPLSDTETKEEALVISTQLGTGEGANPTLAPRAKPGPKLLFKPLVHERDKHIRFEEDTHSYFVHGVPTPSVTTMLDRWFAPFDEVYWSERKATEDTSPAAIRLKWKEEGEKAAALGTRLHEDIENYLGHGQVGTTKEFVYFSEYWATLKKPKVLCCEWRLYDEQIGIAGTCDLLARIDGKTTLIDFKRSKNVIQNGRPKPAFANQTALGCLSNQPDSSYGKYCVQLNLYRDILERHYGQKVDQMIILVLYPGLDRAYRLVVPRMNNEIEEMRKVLGALPA